MHRGSSKDARKARPASEILPLSASPALWTVEVEVARAGRTKFSRLVVPSGTLVREVVRAAGVSPEGSAVLDGDTPIPLDTPVDRELRITVVPTFSGG